MSGACGRGGRFFKEKAPQKPFSEGCGTPHKNTPLPSTVFPPNPLSGAIQVIFVGILFACEKNPHGPREIRGKESSLSFPRISLGLREKLKLLPKNDAKFSCPPEKRFLRSFFLTSLQCKCNKTKK